MVLSAGLSVGGCECAGVGVRAGCLRSQLLLLRLLHSCGVAAASAVGP